MKRRLGLGISLLFLLAATIQLSAQEKPARGVAELEKEIERLKAEVNRLAEQLEGTGRPINLARTSLASVLASSVNGGRDLANEYYGIRNAFDDGDNWIQNINYTYWLSQGSHSQWIEVHFDVPVVITRIEVESRAAFSTRLLTAKGGEENFPEAHNRLDLPQPRGGVRRVRLTFGGRGDLPNIHLDSGCVRVDEVRVLGSVPAGTKYEVATPRLQLSEADAVATARTALEKWTARLASTAQPRVREDAKQIQVTFLQADTGTELFRVTISKVANQITTEPLVLTTPADKAGTGRPRRP